MATFTWPLLKSRRRRDSFILEKDVVRCQTVGFIVKGWSFWGAVLDHDEVEPYHALLTLRANLSMQMHVYAFRCPMIICRDKDPRTVCPIWTLPTKTMPYFPRLSEWDFANPCLPKGCGTMAAEWQCVFVSVQHGKFLAIGTRIPSQWTMLPHALSNLFKKRNLSDDSSRSRAAPEGLRYVDFLARVWLGEWRWYREELEGWQIFVSQFTILRTIFISDLYLVHRREHCNWCHNLLFGWKCPRNRWSCRCSCSIYRCWHTCNMCHGLCQWIDTDVPHAQRDRGVGQNLRRWRPCMGYWHWLLVKIYRDDSVWRCS